LSFWPKLIDGKQSKLSSLIYKLLYLKTDGKILFHGLILLNQYLIRSGEEWSLGDSKLESSLD
jgi:hypothetical protein